MSTCKFFLNEFELCRGCGVDSMAQSYQQKIIRILKIFTDFQIVCSYQNIQKKIFSNLSFQLLHNWWVQNYQIFVRKFFSTQLFFIGKGCKLVCKNKPPNIFQHRPRYFLVDNFQNIYFRLAILKLSECSVLKPVNLSTQLLNPSSTRYNQLRAYLKYHCYATMLSGRVTLTRRPRKYRRALCFTLHVSCNANNSCSLSSNEIVSLTVLHP